MGLLRTLLALAVCFTHTTALGPFPWVSGRAAVHIFFVISGFYIQMVLAERYTPALLGSRWIRNFYAARYWRLFPAYALCALLVLGYAVFVLASSGALARPLASWAQIAQGRGLHAALYGAFVLLTNVSMLGLNLPSSSDLIITPAWSLGVELSFYAVAPVLLKKSDATLWGVLLIGLLLKLVPYGYHAPVFAGIDCFILGALAYRKRSLLTLELPWALPRWQVAAFAFVFLIAACGLPGWSLIPIRNTDNNLDILVYPFLSALFIPTLYTATRSNRVDRTIGELSYPFYIFNELVIEILSDPQVGLVHLSGQILAGLAALLTLLLAFVVTKAEAAWIEPRRARLGKPGQGAGVSPATGDFGMGQPPARD